MLSASNLVWLYGSRASKMYLLSLVTYCEIRESSGRAYLRYLMCRFFLSSILEKVKEVRIQYTKNCPFDSHFYLESILSLDINPVIYYNGALLFQNWSFTDPIGNVYGLSCDLNGFNSRIAYLQMVFPAKTLELDRAY